jgi:cytochrome c556
MRFAADLAPYAFGEYLQQDRDGRYSVVRLPADGDPVAQSMQRVRERDYSLIDTLNEHYSSFNSTMSEPYTNWRKYSYEELEAESEARRQAMTKQILGAVAVVGGIVAGSGASSSAASAAATAAVIGGAYAFKSGFDQRAEVKMHSETVRQLGESFQMEIQPMVVDVEGRTLQLKGSAEEQYAEWRRLLKELYEHETGLPATVGPAT